MTVVDPAPPVTGSRRLRVVRTCRLHQFRGCQDASCAPPPTGTGGSLPVGGSGSSIPTVTPRRDDGSSHGHPGLAAVYEAVGTARLKPERVTIDELDARIASGELVEAFRGTQAVDGDAALASADYIDGDTHFAGMGRFGNGTYFAVESDQVPPEMTAYAYAFPTGMMEETHGSVVRVGIRADAVSVTTEQAFDRYYQAREALRGNKSWEDTGQTYTDREHAIIDANRDVILSGMNTGAFAALLGAQVITVDSAFGNHRVVLDRSVTVTAGEVFDDAAAWKERADAAAG